MECKECSFLRAKMLEMMAKYIGIDDIGYVVATIISKERVKEIECEFKDGGLKDPYVISIKLSKKRGKSWIKQKF